MKIIELKKEEGSQVLIIQKLVASWKMTRDKANEALSKYNLMM